MHQVQHVVDRVANERAVAQDPADAKAVQPRIVRLRLDDGVEIAAVGDVHDQLAEPRTVEAQLSLGEIAGHVADPHPVDVAAVPLVLGDHPTGRRIDVQLALLARHREAVLQRHGHAADGAVPAHRQAARGFDEDEADIAVVAQRGIEDGAGHRVVTARLVHQRSAHPIVVADEIEAPLAHGRTGKRRPPARHQPHRPAAGMAVDAKKSMRHRPPLRSENSPVSA